MKKIIKYHFYGIAKWNLSQFLISWGLALCSPFGSVSGPFTTPGLIVSLEGRKK